MPLSSWFNVKLKRSFMSAFLCFLLATNIAFADKDTRGVKKLETANPSLPTLKATNNGEVTLSPSGCLLPNQQLIVSGDPLKQLNGEWFITVAEKAISLKPHKLSETRYVINLAQVDKLSAGHDYPVYLLKNNTQQPTSVVLKICPSINPLLLLPKNEAD